MAVFSFRAVDAQGKEVRDEIDAANQDDATRKVRDMGYFPMQVAPKGGGRGRGGVIGPAAAAPTRRMTITIGGVSSKALTQFTRQFSTLIDAGLPIVRSLQILGDQQKPGILKNTLIAVREDVEGGSSLSESMSKHPKVFDKLYSNMVKAGEAGGVLDTILARLAEFREKSQKLRRQIVAAMIYPAAVVLISTGILAVIMIFIIPKFEAMFKDIGGGAKLPLLTQILMQGANAIKDYWYLLPGVPFGLYVFVKLITMSPAGRYAIDSIRLRIPVFGMITSKSSVSRFCRTLGTLIASGVPLLDALRIIKGATGNAVVANAVGEVHTSIREGDTIAEPLRHSGVFDDIVVNMIDVGEETGELDRMLIKVADNFDEEVDTLVGGMMSLLEPFLIIGMGLMVGFIVIALFLPLIQLMEGIQ